MACARCSSLRLFMKSSAAELCVPAGVLTAGKPAEAPNNGQSMFGRRKWADGWRVRVTRTHVWRRNRRVGARREAGNAQKSRERKSGRWSPLGALGGKPRRERPPDGQRPGRHHHHHDDSHILRHGAASRRSQARPTAPTDSRHRPSAALLELRSARYVQTEMSDFLLGPFFYAHEEAM